ncbi:MAG: DNA-methyltransferase [Desulfobulbia bacterium]
MSVQILNGDCRDILPTLPEKSVNCCVTSPPYFGLRDYGCAGQIGLEQTPEEFVAALVDVFRGVRRVLRDDGTLWLNLGDTYATQPGKGNNVPQTKWQANSSPESAAHRSLDCGVKPKNLLGIPWMVAFALRADGWYLRSDIIWSKPNPMPESVTDRPTKAHEYLFLLAKREHYYYDHEAIKERSTGQQGAAASFKRETKDQLIPGQTEVQHRLGREDREDSGTRNKRSVWDIPTAPYSGAHFAVFPPKLIEPCILAGCPVGGTVLDCFGGSGTTGRVAVEHRRNAVLIELNPDYVVLQQARTSNVQLRAF